MFKLVDTVWRGPVQKAEVGRLRRPRTRRIAGILGAGALGAAAGLLMATGAWAYGPSPTVPPVTPTTTTSPSTTTTTVPSSTTTTTPASTTTSIGASPGTTEPSGSANPQPVGVSATTVTPGSTVSVDIPTDFGAVADSHATTPAPCGANVPVSIELLLIQDGQSPSQLATATSNATGGLDPVKVTIPKSTITGTYVVYAQCNNAAGILEILTSPLVLVTSIPGGSQVATAPKFFVVSSAYGTPAERTALEDAIRAEIANTRSGAGASYSRSGEVQLAVASLAKLSDPPGSSRALSYGLTAAVLVLMAAGLVTLRRRRSLPTS
jgi:hypothetical protein